MISYILTRVRRLFSRSPSDAQNDLETESVSPDEADLLTAEQELVELLTDEGGLMWQRDVREKTGWGPAKTSRLLSQMESEGTIQRRQIGREKAVYFPDIDPE